MEYERAAEHWCESLYQQKARELILYGRALGLSHCEAEDVLQETFAALLGKNDLPEKPEHYCLRAYRNRVFNYRRSLWRRLTREFESQSWFEPAADHSAAEQAAIQCLYQLPVEQREVIVLKIWHGNTYEEISELIGCSPNTVAGRYRYGLQKLQAIFKTLSEETYETIGESITRLDSAQPIAQAGETAI